MMNMEQVKAMTDEELRIKVAELCGWTHEPLDPKRDNAIWCVHWYPPKTTIDSEEGNWWKGFGAVPNYPFDLNAMQEAEKSLKGRVKNSDLWMDELYVRNLVEVIGCMPLSRTHLVRATARKRAEAFVLTMESK